MLDYFHASDLQAALAALTSVEESFHEMYRICTDSITEQRRIYNYVLVFAAQKQEEERFYACAQTLHLHFTFTLDSAVLRTAGSSFHHWGPKTEKSCDFADRPLLALSDGGTLYYAQNFNQGGRTGRVVQIGFNQTKNTTPHPQWKCMHPRNPS